MKELNFSVAATWRRFSNWTSSWIGNSRFSRPPPRKTGALPRKNPSQTISSKIVCASSAKVLEGRSEKFSDPPLLNFSGSSDSFSQLGQYIPKLLTNFCDVFWNLMSSKIMTLFICIVFLPPGYYYYSYSFFFLIPNITITKLCLWNLHWRSSQNLSLIPFLIVLETSLL